MAPPAWAATNGSTSAISMPVGELVKIRATVKAGLAKLVDEVNQIAETMNRPAASGTASPRARTHPEDRTDESQRRDELTENLSTTAAGDGGPREHGFAEHQVSDGGPCHSTR